MTVVLLLPFDPVYPSAGLGNFARKRLLKLVELVPKLPKTPLQVELFSAFCFWAKKSLIYCVWVAYLNEV